MIEAVVFDFDGTLVDSYSRRPRAHERVRNVLLGYLERNGRAADDGDVLERISEAEQRSLETGQWDRDEWWRTILAEYGIDSPPEEVVRRATMVYWETTLEESEVFPGVESMLGRLSSDGVPIGVISDTDGLEGMKDRRIAECDISEYFDAVVVAGEDTPDPKPDTEPFTLIASRLGIDPENCLYVGDNPHTDVEGAREVGMTTVLVDGGDASDAPVEPHYVVDAPESLPETVFDILDGDDLRENC